MDKLHTKNFVIGFLTVTLIIIAIVCKFLSWNEMRIDKVDIRGIPEISSAEGAIFNIENAYYEKNGIEGEKLTVSGWCIIQGREAKPVAMHILIKNTNTGECYKMPTVIITREDVTAHFNEGIDYNCSGFSVYTNCKKFDFKKSAYEVVMLYEIAEEKYIIPSGSIITVKGDGN